jgi:hypothetical protein
MNKGVGSVGHSIFNQSISKSVIPYVNEVWLSVGQWAGPELVSR